MLNPESFDQLYSLLIHCCPRLPSPSNLLAGCNGGGCSTRSSRRQNAELCLWPPPNLAAALIIKALYKHFSLSPQLLPPLFFIKFSVCAICTDQAQMGLLSEMPIL